MDPYLSEWLNLLLRWLHVFSAILWIGQTALFSFLESRLTVEADPATGKEKIWLVHGGGFFVVEKDRAPQVMPRILHWFKWESFSTWISGFLLLCVAFYVPRTSTLIDIDAHKDPVAAANTAMGVGLALLVACWAVYDLLWMSPLAKKSERATTAISLALLVGAAFLLSRFMIGRAVWIHMGAIMGTIMTANVWMRILPGQKRMVAALAKGEAPDMSYGARGKQRSTHNTFMAVPLTLIMLSSHFPTATGGFDWKRLFLFLFMGFGVRKLMNLHNAAAAKTPSPSNA